MRLERFLEVIRPEKTVTEGVTIYRGSLPLRSHSFVGRLLPLDFVEQDWLGDQTFNVWLSSSRQVIITFCEGDITVQRFTRAVDYRNEVAKQEAFYLEQIGGKPVAMVASGK